MKPIPPEQSLIEYPCHFPVKVMGAQVAGFLETMAGIAKTVDPGFEATTIEQRPSSSGKYLGLTLHVYVTGREQLDGLYRALSGHPMVKVVL